MVSMPSYKRVWTRNAAGVLRGGLLKGDETAGVHASLLPRFKTLGASLSKVSGQQARAMKFAPLVELAKACK
eukprot:1265454-Prymnesium_polylepis.3